MSYKRVSILTNFGTRIEPKTWHDNQIKVELVSTLKINNPITFLPPNIQKPQELKLNIHT